MEDSKAEVTEYRKLIDLLPGWKLGSGWLVLGPIYFLFGLSYLNQFPGCISYEYCMKGTFVWLYGGALALGMGIGSAIYAYKCGKIRARLEELDSKSKDKEV